MADLVLADRDLRAGLADGVRLPGQGGDPSGLSAERPGATYTTPALRAAFPCTHVGVHWRTDGGDQRGLRVELRASRDGQSWMPWRPVQREAHGPDRAAEQTEPETFGALVGARLGTWLQARLTFEQAGPEIASVSALTLTCLNSRRPTLADLTPPAPLIHERWGPSAARAPHVGAERGENERLLLPLASQERGLGGEVFLRAGVTGFLERVVTREAWGADESLRFKDGVNQWPAAYVAPSLLVVHHTATDNDYGDAEAEVRSIYAYHAVTQGWGDIGYHLLIDSSGQVYEGRYGREPDDAGRREIVSENVVAGHALDYNYGSVGIALLGNFQTREPGQAALGALVEALAFMAQRYGIDPTTSMSYVRARGDGTALWRDRLDAISGHRDCIPTECPGNNVYPLLPTIRQRVEELLGERGPSVRITRGPAERNLWPGDLTFAWEGEPSTAEVSARLAAWRRIPGSDKIEPLSGYVDDERPVWGPWTRERGLSVPLPPDARGIYTLFTRSRDAAGREGRVSARWPVVVDRHVVVDDADELRTHREGAWERERDILGYNGTGYQAAAPGQHDARFRWQLSVPEDGTYRLQASWTEAPNRSVQAVYRLSQGGHSLGEATVDQQTPGGMWDTLLEAPLVADVPCIVELAGSADGVVVADAIRLVLVP
jgi:N-acetylmuramoyl-L-alanine amidase